MTAGTLDPSLVAGAPPPPDEGPRLAAVHALGLLDTPREERFERITRTAQRVLRSPIALISLVDAERQWFTSCPGLGIGVRETARRASFCAYAIHADDPFLVPDARADQRFVANPLVTGSPYIRAYLGIPLHAGGYRVGTLCVLDAHPRLFTPEQVAALVDLSSWAESELHRGALDRMQDEFVSVVSHELRTPLTSIRGSVGLLASGALGSLPPEAKRVAGIALANTDRLVRVVDDIVDAGRIESGQIEIHRASVAVAEVLDEAVAAVAGEAALGHVGIRVSGVDRQVWVDAGRIVQALANVLSNAVTFSPAGATVDLAASVTGDVLALRVTDHGPGIPTGMEKRIFERFAQVDASDRRERGGSGLGLAIAKGIVEQHGGTVSVQSAPGRGSTFTLSVPCGVVVGAGARGSRRVLMVDDDPSLQEVAVLALERVGGYSVIPARSGEEAVALAREHRPEGILLDVMMPGLDGPSTLALLRADPATASIPVVFLTAKTQAAERERLAALAVAGILSKPFNPMTLAAELGRLMGWS